MIKNKRDEIIKREREYWQYRSELEWLSEKGIKNVMSIIPPISGDILELCSGSGMFTKRIPPNYNTYTCLDLSHPLLKTLHKELPQIRPVQGNAEEPVFSTESFDMVLVFAGLHHLPDMDKAIHSAYRVLRPGGTFIAFEPNEDCWYRRPMLYMNSILDLYTDDERFLTPKEVTASLENSGFRDITAHYISPDYSHSHLSTFFNKVLARMIRIASSLSSLPNWQSFFVVNGTVNKLL